MTITMRRAALPAGAILQLSLAACGGSSEGWVTATRTAERAGEPVHITGRILHHQVEGGFYAIRSEDGVTYDPTNLPEEFRRDSLPVEAEARRLENAMGVHQVGPIVELERIRRR
jgi:hypothetical protein